MHKLYLYYTVEAKLMEYLIMCIGNINGGDDAIGPYIASKLKEKESDDFVVLDCGTIPENYTSVVKQHKPRNLVIIDAVEMRLKPGEIRIVPKEKIGKMHISTHGIPLSVLINYLESCVENILLIGIQPKVTTNEMTISIKKSGDKVVEIIKGKRIDEINILK